MSVHTHQALDANVCILLAAYNGKSWISEQLNSILNQSHKRIHIYISDDNSIDTTIPIIKNFVSNHPNISLLPHKKKSSNAAQNFFRLLRDVEISEYEYIGFSDQDDIWDKDKITLAIKLLKVKNADGYSSNITAFWPDGRAKIVSKAQPQKKFDYMFESAGPGCTFIISKKLALSLQDLLKKKQTELSSISLHDWFIYAFARSNGYTWYIDPTPTMLYRQHAENVVGANTGIKAFMARLSKLKQGWYLQQISLIAKELGYSDATPIKKIMRLSALDKCYLAIFSYQYRRRLRDRFAFAFYILFLAKKP